MFWGGGSSSLCLYLEARAPDPTLVQGKPCGSGSGNRCAFGSAWSGLASPALPRAPGARPPSAPELRQTDGWRGVPPSPSPSPPPSVLFHEAQPPASAWNEVWDREVCWPAPGPRGPGLEWCLTAGGNPGPQQSSGG